MNPNELRDWAGKLMSRPSELRFSNRYHLAAYLREEADRMERAEPVGYFIATGASAWEKVSDQYQGDPDVVPLYLHPAPQSVPPGHWLAPMEPTKAMQQAGGHVNSEWLNDDAPIGEGRYVRPMSGVWKAMRDAYIASPAAPAAPAPADAVDALQPAARDVLAERRRQVEAEGWTAEHDDAHGTGDIAAAASAYALEASAIADGMKVDPTRGPPFCWPWSLDWWKPSDPRRNLVKAGALILAEIERLDRAALAAADKERGCD